MAATSLGLLTALCISWINFQPGQAALGKSSLSYSVNEGSSINLFVGDVLADSEADRGLSPQQKSTLRFAILPSTRRGNNLFKIDAQSGKLSVAQDIDFDEPSLCTSDPCYVQLQVSVQPENLGGLVQIKVQILDVNDNPPQFPTADKLIRVPEDRTQFQAMLEPATDKDGGQNGRLSYRMIETTDTFELREQMGMLFIRLKTGRTLDFERKKGYEARLEACDGGTPSPRCASQRIVIEVVDTNDNSPKVTGTSTINLVVAEDYPVNTALTKINATDADSGDNARLGYSIANDADTVVRSFFAVHRNSGSIVLRQALNARDHEELTIPIIIRDFGDIPRFARATVNIKVRDVNNHRPVIQVSSINQQGGIQRSRIEVMEDATPGKPIAFVTATDNDLGENAKVTCGFNKGASLHFGLSKESFTSNSATFKLKTKRTFDFETGTSVSLTVKCWDAGLPSLTSTMLITVYIINVNEGPPVFKQNTYETSVEEERSDAFVVNVLAIDQDANSEPVYSISGDGAELFKIDPQTGRIQTRTKLDRERLHLEDGKIKFTVTAVDQADRYRKQFTATASVTVSVMDVNDQTPRLVPPLMYSVQERRPAYTIVSGGPDKDGRLRAKDGDLGVNAKIGYKLLKVFSVNDGTSFGNTTFDIDSRGVLRTTKELDREQVELYNLVVKVFDHGVNPGPLSMTATLTVSVLDIDDEPPQFVFPRLGDNWVNITAAQRQGDEVARLEVRDPDKHTNFTFTVLRGSKSFSVHQLTGSVRVAGPLSPGQHELRIRVDDNAQPMTHYDVQTLYINVFGLYRAHQTNARDARINLTIIIAMVVITAVISVGLVTAIVCVRKRTALPIPSSYMGSDMDKGEPPCQCHCPDGEMTMSSGIGREPVYHQLCTSPRVDRLYPLSTFAGGGGTLDTHDHSLHQQLQHHLGHHKPQSQLTVEIRNNEVLVNNLDLDGESADSGRGGSEEGSGHPSAHQTSAQLTPQALGIRSPSRSSGRSQRTGVTSPVPSQSNNCRCHILPEEEAVQSGGCSCSTHSDGDSRSHISSFGPSSSSTAAAAFRYYQQQAAGGALGSPPSYASLPRNGVSRMPLQNQLGTLPRRAISPLPLVPLPPTSEQENIVTSASDTFFTNTSSFQDPSTPAQVVNTRVNNTSQL